MMEYTYYTWLGFLITYAVIFVIFLIIFRKTQRFYKQFEFSQTVMRFMFIQIIFLCLFCSILSIIILYLHLRNHYLFNIELALFALFCCFLLFILFKIESYMVTNFQLLQNQDKLLIAEVNAANENLMTKANALAKANANMTKLYLDLELANGVIKEQQFALEEINSELSHLNGVANIINQTLDIDIVLDKTFDSFRSLFNFDIAIVQLFDAEDQFLQVTKIHGVSDEKMRNKLFAIKTLASDLHSLALTAITAQTIHLVSKFNSSSIVSEADDVLYKLIKFESALYFPLQVKDNVLGCVGFFAIDTQLNIDEKKMSIIHNHIPLISLAINNAVTYLDLKNTKLSLMESKKIAELTNVFRQFVPEQFLNKVARNGIESIKFGYGEKVNISILFSDIRSFSTHSEILESRILFDFVNDYFNFFSDKVYANNGFIDKFVGDAVMSLFEGADDNQHYGAIDAVNVAIALQHSLAEFNTYAVKKFNLRQKVSIGVGIHTGSVILGTIGSGKHMESTVLGDNVNIASRLEALNKEYKTRILISDDTYQKLANTCNFTRPLGFTKIRGRVSIVKIHEVFACDNEEERMLKLATKKYLERAVSHCEQGVFTEAKAQLICALQVAPNDETVKILINTIDDYHICAVQTATTVASMEVN